jgi:hypothetical protein
METLRHEIKAFLNVCPEANEACSCDGSRLIHIVAASRNPDVLILEAILTQNPESGCCCDGYGLSALHVLLDHEAPSIEAVRVVLLHSPDAAK